MLIFHEDTEYFRLGFLKSAQDDDGNPCRAYCRRDDPDIVAVIVSTPGAPRREVEFPRVGDHFPQLQQCLWLLEIAFEIGQLTARKEVRAVLGIK